MGDMLCRLIMADRPRHPGPEWWLLVDLALDANDATRRTAPGLAYMMERTHAPEGTIYRWLKKLRTNGQLQVVQHSISGGRRGGQGRRAVYEILLREDQQAAAEDAQVHQRRVVFADTAAGYLTGFPVVSPERGDELATMRYRQYLDTSEWKARRLAVLEWAAHSCQVCCRGADLHVHHRTYVRRGMERPSDLIALCGDCHALFHGKLPTSEGAEDLAGQGQLPPAA